MTLRAALLVPLLALPLLPAAPVLAQTKGGPAPAAPVPTLPDLPPDLVPCTRLEGVTADPNAREAERTRAVLRDGRVATIVLDLPGGRTTRTDLTPGRRDGTSVRLLAFPRPAAPGAPASTPPAGAWNTVFNLATVGPDGTILVETWLGYTDRPAAPPVHNWYRLRCEAGAAPATVPPAALPAVPPPGPPSARAPSGTPAGPLPGPPPGPRPGGKG